MSSAQVDEFILSDVGSTWQKVAIVVGRAISAHSIEFPEGEDESEFVARRVEALINDGRLEVQGSVKNWRHSEVRRP